MILSHSSCEICGKHLEYGQETVEIRTDTKSLFGIGIPCGVAFAHVKCLDIEHDEDYPERTSFLLARSMAESKEVDEA